VALILTDIHTVNTTLVLTYAWVKYLLLSTVCFGYMVIMLKQDQPPFYIEKPGSY